MPVFVFVVLGPGSRSLSQRLGTISAAYTQFGAAYREKSQARCSTSTVNSVAFAATSAGVSRGFEGAVS